MWKETWTLCSDSLIVDLMRTIDIKPQTNKYKLEKQCEKNKLHHWSRVIFTLIHTNCILLLFENPYDPTNSVHACYNLTINQVLHLCILQNHMKLKHSYYNNRPTEFQMDIKKPPPLLNKSNMLKSCSKTHHRQTKPPTATLNSVYVTIFLKNRI